MGDASCALCCTGKSECRVWCDSLAQGLRIWRERVGSGVSWRGGDDAEGRCAVGAAGGPAKESDGTVFQAGAGETDLAALAQECAVGLEAGEVSTGGKGVIESVVQEGGGEIGAGGGADGHAIPCVAGVDDEDVASGFHVDARGGVRVDAPPVPESQEGVPPDEGTCGAQAEAGRFLREVFVPVEAFTGCVDDVVGDCFAEYSGAYLLTLAEDQRREGEEQQGMGSVCHVGDWWCRWWWLVVQVAVGAAVGDCGSWDLGIRFWKNARWCMGGARLLFRRVGRMGFNLAGRKREASLLRGSLLTDILCHEALLPGRECLREAVPRR